MRKRRRRRHARRRLMRRVAFGAGLVVVVVVLLVVWLGVRGLLAQRALTDSAALLETVRSQVLAANSDAARTGLGAAQDATVRARHLTGDPVWALATHLPVLGSTFGTVRGIARAGDELAQTTLPSLVQVGDRLAPKKLAAGRGQIDLAPLAQAQPQLATAAAQLHEVVGQVRALPDDVAVSQVGDARDELRTRLSSLQGTLDTAALAAKVAPGMLGADGPRRYFLALQQNAEARGTGGLSGAFGILLADHGTLTIEQLGSDVELHNRRPVMPSGLGADYDQLWGVQRPNGVYQNANFRVTVQVPAVVVSTARRVSRRCR